MLEEAGRQLLAALNAAQQQVAAADRLLAQR
jgi:hypothetical protein